MSGFARKAALVVGAVALVATTAGLAAPAVAATATTAATAGGIAGVSAATLAAIGTYGGLAAGVLSAVSAATAPGMSNQGSQTSFQTNPQSGLPYAMGRTRMSGLRIYADTNTTPGYTKFNDLLWFGAMLSIGGQIEEIEKFTVDNELVTFDGSGNAIGAYRNYQSQRLHMGGPQATGLSVALNGGFAPGWTAQHRLSGITHALWGLRYNKDGEMYGAGAPEPAWIAKWVRVYDPRLDSTYPGGSGPCRALDETTYVWSQNPGLHALTWALGRWQNGKRTCGIGAPVSTIRVGDFVECANVCDANGWKAGGVEWTTDSKWDSFKRILQAGGARPTKTGAMIGCIVSTPRTAVATIEAWHLLDGLSIAATKSRRDRFNTVIPRYVDEASDWSVISGTAISVPDFVTADRGQRTKEIDYPLVQVFDGEEATQPGQLAAYDIVNSREAGPIDFTTGPEWIGLKTGDVVLINVPEEGLVNQPILITRRAPDPSTGKVSFSAQTETMSKHAFALGQTTTPPSPFSLTAPDLKPPAPIVASWAATGALTGEGLPAIIVVGSSDMPSADAVVIDYKKSGEDDWMRSAIVSANAPVQHVIAPLASATAYDVRVGYRVGDIDGDFLILSAVTGTGKLSGIENGATVGAPNGTMVGNKLAQVVVSELGLAGNLGFSNESWIKKQEGFDPATGYLRSTLMVNYLGIVVAAQTIGAGPGGSFIGFRASNYYFFDDDDDNPTPLLTYEKARGMWKMTAIEIDTLKVGSVITGSIALNAVADGDSVALASPKTGNGTWQTAVTYTIVVPPPVADEVVDWQVMAIVTGSQGFPSGDRTWNTRLLFDGAQKGAAGGEKSEDSLAMSGRVNWGPGTYVIKVEWNGQSGVTLSEMNMTLLWFKR